MDPNYSVPEWMRTEENYIPQKDHDGFITKSSLQIMSVLQRARKDGSIGAIGASAPFKLFVTFLLILLTALSKNMFFTYCVLAGVFVRICMLPGKILGKVVWTSLSATIFSALLLLPSVFMGSPHTMLTVSLKVFVSIGLTSTMAMTTPWNQLTEGLRFYHIPDLIIFILDITLKYIVVLGDLCLHILEALKLRSVGKNRKKDSSMSGVLGVTFLKSREMADEMYGAMRCRGFEGEYHRPRKFRIQKWDVLVILISFAVIVLFIYLEGAIV